MSPRQAFGLTWWGRAWIEAIEERARFDPNRLPRGRAYARRDHVLSIAAEAGEITAIVEGSRLTPYDVVLRVRAFTDTEWDRVIDTITARAAHAAALLDGELLPEILDDVADSGVDLLPGEGELVAQCTCADEADPCKHAAAVCYLVARMLDEDPFELFHLRGRGRERLLADVRARRGRSARGGAASGEGAADDDEHDADRPRSPVPTVPARTAHARVPTTMDDLRALDLRPTTAHPGSPPELPPMPPSGTRFRAAELELLATDAAERAFALAVGLDDGEPLSEREDIARWAAKTIDSYRFDALADRAQLPERQLIRWAAAWTAGGREGIAVSESPLVASPPGDGARADDDPLVDGLASDETFPDETSPDGPPSDEMGTPPPEYARVAAVTALGPFDDGLAITEEGNRITAGNVQLRWAPSGRWYRFARMGGEWRITGGPATDPRRLVAPLLRDAK